MIEGRLHLTIEERKTTFLRKERCMFRGLLYILQGYFFLKEVRPLLEGNLQLINTRSVLTKILAKATLYLVDECDECIMICMGAQTVAFAVVSKWVGVLVCSNLRTVLSPPTVYNVYYFFF